MLFFPDEREFATGSTRFTLSSSDSRGNNPRIYCPVRVGDVEVEAVLDTGAIGFLCRPDLARHISPHSHGSARNLIRGVWIVGSIERHDLTFVADEGLELTIDAQFFLPNEDQEDDWPENVPSFIGFQNCLEHIRFAIDPGPEERFYFGKY